MGTQGAGPPPWVPPTPSGWGGGPSGRPCGLSGMLWGWGAVTAQIFMWLEALVFIFLGRTS